MYIYSKLLLKMKAIATLILFLCSFGLFSQCIYGDCKNGFGRRNHTNGDYYEGQWSGDARWGEGTYVWANGDKYEGEWQNSKMHGFGKFTSTKGSIQEGLWSQDKLTESKKVKHVIFRSGGDRIKDLRIDSVVTIGMGSSITQEYYNTINAHNEFKFFDIPLSIGKNNSPDLITPSRTYIEYKKELDYILLGINSLEKDIESIEKSLEEYKNVINAKGYHSESSYLVAKRVEELYLINDDNPKEIEEWNEILESRDYCKNIKNFRLRKIGKKYFICKSFQCENLEKRINKKLKKGKLTKIEFNEREKLLSELTGYNENYFKFKNELKTKKNLLSHTKSKYIVKLETGRSNSYPQKFNYVGKSEMGVPNGFGYLLTESNQLILSGIWYNGIPILIYEVNIYHSSNGENFKYCYIPPEISSNNTFIFLTNLEYSTTKIKTFNLYIGEFNRNNPLEVTGFGTSFSEEFNKENLSYYQGEWKENKKNGKGIFLKNSGGIIYSGNFSNNEMTTGTCTLEDGEVQTGEFEHWKLQGKGELTTSNGIKKNGYFDKGVFVKSTEQFQKEIDEDNRKAEEQRLANEKSEQEKRKRDLVCSLNLAPPRPPYKYIDNRVMCAYCNDKYARYKLGGVENEVEAKTNFAVNQLVFHVLDNNLSEEHLNNDITKLVDLATEWGAEFAALGLDGILLASTYVVGLPMSVTQAFEFAKMGLLKRQKTFTVDKYDNTSRFCSERCYRYGSTGEFDF